MGSPHEADLEEFCTKNSLSDRVVDALHSIGKWEQRHVMGLDGSKNSFMLTGNVRDPDAVVMSRLKRLQQEPLRNPSSGRPLTPRKRETSRGQSPPWHRSC